MNDKCEKISDRLKSLKLHFSRVSPSASMRDRRDSDLLTSCFNLSTWVKRFIFRRMCCIQQDKSFGEIMFGLFQKK